MGFSGLTRVQAPVEAVEDVEAEMIAYIRIRKDIMQPAASGFRGKGRQPANPNPNDETLFSSHAQSPKTSPILPAGSHDAFKAMVMHFTTQSRKKNANLSLFIYTDKPMKSDGLTWDTGEGDLEDPFDFSTVEAFTGSSSASIDEASKPYLDILCEKYVTGSNLLYPGIRVYMNTRGESWELNDTRLSTWASHMARRTPGVDDSHPPNTAWFNGKYILRPFTTPAAITTPTPVPAAIPTPASDICKRFMDFAMMSMMHNMSQQAPAVQRTLSMSAIQVSSAPASPIRLARISSDEFCSFYGVSETDKGRFTELEYQPGNRAIEQMEKAEWLSVSFKFLLWSNILTVYRKFISDVKSGAWDHIMQV
ncbi:hypothetical protein C8R41DRAFT_871376 [Lentinula lateritia]|uniref:Fungal-type protein kinase domain-containing protein n=1 Tax=Lentinula lateritia TaxID=40482 RepID=A0ABQ8UZV5_9AGAR|nr:hypothetical protein C8R41DRAFT_871376 [Lentinula lateritia]